MSSLPVPLRQGLSHTQTCRFSAMQASQQTVGIHQSPPISARMKERERNRQTDRQTLQPAVMTLSSGLTTALQVFWPSHPASPQPSFLQSYGEDPRELPHTCDLDSLRAM